MTNSELAARNIAVIGGGNSAATLAAAMIAETQATGAMIAKAITPDRRDYPSRQAWRAAIRANNHGEG